MRSPDYLEAIANWDCMAAAKKPPKGPHPPYQIFKRGKKYVVKNGLGMVKAKFDSLAKAVQYQKALYSALPDGFKIPKHKKHPNPS